jgi:Metallo-peptidase family M12
MQLSAAFTLLYCLCVPAMASDNGPHIMAERSLQGGNGNGNGNGNANGNGNGHGPPDHVIQKFNVKNQIKPGRTLQLQEANGSTVNVGGTEISLSPNLLKPVEIFAEGAQVRVDGVEVPLQQHVWKSISDSSVTIVKGADGKLLSASKRRPGNGRGNRLDVLPMEDGTFLATVDEDDISEDELAQFSLGEPLSPFEGTVPVHRRSLRSEPTKQGAETDQVHPRGRLLATFDIVEMDIVIDSYFCAKHGGPTGGGPTNVQAKAAAIVAEASAVHFEPIGVKLKIKSFKVHCDVATDPIRSLIASSTIVCGNGLIVKFQEYVALNSGAFAADLVHLFYGFDMPNDFTIGCAYEPGLCVGGGYKTGIDEMTWSDSLANQGRLLAHEVGHNLHAAHVADQSLMFGSICSSCTFSAVSQTAIKATVAANSHCIHQETTTAQPTMKPTTRKPTTKPTTAKPTVKPTVKPTTRKPTTKPTTGKPTTKPTVKPTTRKPTMKPTV